MDNINKFKELKNEVDGAKEEYTRLKALLGAKTERLEEVKEDAVAAFGTASVDELKDMAAEENKKLGSEIEKIEELLANIRGQSGV